MATTASIAGGGAASADPPSPSKRKVPGIVGTSAKDVIKDSYIVVFKDRKISATAARAGATALTKTYGGTVRRTFTKTVRGFAAKMTEAQAKKLAGDPDVAYVEQNRRVTKSDTQANPPSWGLDRLDQTWTPYNKLYTYPNTATNVHAYVIDTGVRISHTEFGGRASYGIDTVDGDAVADDCNGHGTHVAGTIGGTNVGVAKGVQLVAVRVLDCTGSGTLDGVIAGVDWVTANAVKPAVANMSLGGGASTALDDAVQASIASGITYAVAAGNDADDACFYSPARVPAAITVGATDEFDFTTSFSNFGQCLDINAPGANITSAAISSDTARVAYSGTSMASPHVAGAAALLLSTNPAWLPAQVRTALVNDGVLNGARGYVEDTTTKLLQVGTRTIPNTVTGIKANANKKVVTAESRGTKPLIANRGDAGIWERFDVVNVGGGFVALRAKINNLYVTAESAGAKPLIANRSAVGTWEKFTLVNNADGSFSLRANANGRYVTAESGGTKPLIANRTAIGAWEKFYWTTPATTIGVRAAVNGKIVTAESAGAKPLVANRAAVGAWERFDIIDAGLGYIALRAQVNNRIVVAESTGSKPLIANRTAIGAWEVFYLVHFDNKLILISNANGKFVNAPGGGASPLIANYVYDPVTTPLPPSSTQFTYVF
ncbi:S8 family serine peptidase [Phytohabitans rumicis]|nr:S8 family serine peptidase [Phytohabitans rumicis]